MAGQRDYLNARLGPYASSPALSAAEIARLDICRRNYLAWLQQWLTGKQRIESALSSLMATQHAAAAHIARLARLEQAPRRGAHCSWEYGRDSVYILLPFAPP